jgi:hypothetical protein
MGNGCVIMKLRRCYNRHTNEATHSKHSMMPDGAQVCKMRWRKPVTTVRRSNYCLFRDETISPARVDYYHLLLNSPAREIHLIGLMSVLTKVAAPRMMVT